MRSSINPIHFPNRSTPEVEEHACFFPVQIPENSLVRMTIENAVNECFGIGGCVCKLLNKLVVTVYVPCTFFNNISGKYIILDCINSHP